MEKVRIKRLIPKRVKRALADLLGITYLNERIDHLEERLLEPQEALWERSRRRWRKSEPTIHLTWAKKVTGDNFIAKVSSYNAFDCQKNVLEIGAGYGRLLTSCLDKKAPFKEYVGVDISPENIKFLRKKFSGKNIHFILGDAEKVSFDSNFDVVLSSLTFKHLFSSFEEALCNVVNYVNPGGVFFFDLIEGKRRYFDNDGVTYIRWYTRPEILKILGNVSLELVAFDQVQHNRENSRLLVVARKPKESEIEVMDAHL